MKKILIVEDDHFFANRISELLIDRGVAPDVHHTAQDAVKAPLDDIAAAIIDVMLPNEPSESGITVEESRGGFQTGVAIARRIKRLKPEMPLLLFSGGAMNQEVADWARENRVGLAMKGDGPREVIGFLQSAGAFGAVMPPRAFIVHGHNEKALLDLKNYIQNVLKWQEPVVLREQQNGGRTIIEKFEDLSTEVDYVFILMTADDKVVSATVPDDEKRRSRQNVIFELGFFYGKLRRKSGRVIVLHEGGVELPSDISGIIWIDISKGIAAAGEEIRREVAT